jgi:cell division protein FtsB
MNNFQKKGMWRNVAQSKPVLALLSFTLIIFAWNILIFLNKMEDTNKNKKIAEDKVTALKLQKEKLTADISNLQTEQGKEKILRENFGLAKDGENLIVITEDKNPLAPAKPASSGFFSFFKNLFK